MKSLRLLLSFTLLLFPLFSQEKNLTADHSPAKSLLMNANAISTIVYNTGEISGPGVTSNTLDLVWKGLGYGYEFGFMIGAKVPTEHNPTDSVKIISEGIGASSHSTADGDFAPDGITKWGFLPVPGYGNTGSLEIANNQNPFTWDSSWPQWPGKFGGPIADLETFYAVDDFSNAEFDYFPFPADTTIRGLGIKVEARLYQFAHPNLEDVLFSFFEIQNMSPKPLTQMVAGIFGDPHIGGAQDYYDDSQNFDSIHQILYSWDVDNRSGIPNLPPGYFGMFLIKTPFSLGLTSISAMPYGGTLRPKNDQLMYDKLSQGFFDPAFMYSTDSYNKGDYVQIMGTGSFSLEENEKTEIGIVYAFADDVEGLIERTTTVHQEYKIRFGQQGPPVVISTPVKNQKYQSSTLQIEWTGPAADNDTTVDIYCSNDAEGVWKLVASRVANSGQYSWNIDTLPDGIFYKVYIIHSVSGTISYGATDGYFTIDHPSESAPEIKLIAPKNIAMAEGTIPVQWLAGDADGDSVSISILCSLDSGYTFTEIASVSNNGLYNFDSRQIGNSPFAVLKIAASSKDTSSAVITKPFRIKNPYRSLTDSLAFGHTAGRATGMIYPGYIDSTQLTGHTYRTTFDSAGGALRYSLKDLTIGQVKLEKEPMTFITGSGKYVDGMRIWFRDDVPGLDTSGSKFASPLANVIAKVARPTYGNVKYAPVDFTITFGSFDTTATGELISPLDSAGTTNPAVKVVKVPFTISIPDDTTKVTFLVRENPSSPGKQYRWDFGEEIVILTPSRYAAKSNNTHAGITFTKINPASPSGITPGSVFTIAATKPFTAADIFEFSADPQYGEPTGIDGEKIVPAHFALEQNFPNPFNPVTTIRFSLARDGMTTLKIFDIMGREITTLAAEYLRQGIHEYQWDGTNGYSQQAATGIYFYRLQSGNNVSVKKMLLMK